MVDPRLVKQLDLEREGLGWIVGIQTVPIQIPFVTVRGAAIGRCPLKPFKAGIIDLTNLRIGVQLVLGVNAFRGYRLQFNFAQGKLYLLS